MKSNGKAEAGKSYGKNIIREIKGSLGRFLAILAITALGVGFFCGLRGTKSSMIKTADEYLERANMYDLRAVSTLGWDGENIEALSAADGISTVYGYNSVDFLCEETGNTVIHSFSLSQDTDLVTLTAGRMPEKANECVADEFLFDSSYLYKEISLSSGNSEETFDDLAYDTFTIVGLCNSPFYMSFDRGTSTAGNGSVAGFIGLLPEAYTADWYSEIHITSENCGGEIYSGEYEDSVEALSDAFTPVFEDQATERYERVISDANEEITDAKTELSDAEAEIADAEETLRDARQEYDDAKAEADEKLADGARQLDDAAKQLEDLKKQLDSNVASLSSAKTALTDGISAAESALAAYGLDPNDTAGALSKIEMFHNMGFIDDGTYQNAVSGINTLTGLRDQLAQVESGLAACTDGYYSYNYGVEQYEISVKEYEDAKKEAEEKLADGLEEIEDGERELADAKEELEEGRRKLADAEEELAELEEPTVYVLDRTSTVCYSTFESDSDIVQGVSRVFPIFFFAIAALVCSTTMNRMVVEQRTQIGTFKALGYRTSAIVGKYLVYSGAASLAGWAIGFFGGSILFPKVIWKGYSIMYYFSDDIIITKDLRLGFISLAVSLICAMGTTYITCRSVLKEVPAQLLRPAAPAGGGRLLLERVGFIWNRISFLYKVSLRNIVRYKKRLFLMILGIGGCTALLVTGFGINDSVSDIVDNQYEEIAVYDIAVTFSKSPGNDDRELFLSQSGLDGDSVFYLHQATTDLSANGKTQKAYFTLCGGYPEGFIDLHDEKGNSLEYPGTGEALICVNLSDMLGLETGDSFTYIDGDSRELKLRVSGICENFVYNYFYVNSSTCLDQWGELPEEKTALVVIDEKTDPNEAGARIAGCDNVISVNVNENLRTTVGRMMQALDYIVVLIIFCAAALVFVVLYNLTNINITERMREIATIKVLGFHSVETAAYVFRENIILALIGALLGLPLGRLLHSFVIGQIKINMMHFPVRVAPQSLLWSFLLTVLFTLCVDGVLLFKLKNIDMAGSLKSVE